MIVTRLEGSHPSLFVRAIAVGVYIRRSRYAEVMNGRINTPVTLKELRHELREITNTVTNLTYVGNLTVLNSVTHHLENSTR